MLTTRTVAALFYTVSIFFLLHFFFVAESMTVTLYNINYNSTLLVCRLCSIEKKEASNWHLVEFSILKNKSKWGHWCFWMMNSWCEISWHSFLRSLVLIKCGVQITHIALQERFEKSKSAVICLEAPNECWTMACNKKHNNRTVKRCCCCALRWWLHSY